MRIKVVSLLVERLTEPPEWARLMEEALTMPGHVSDIYNRFYRYSFRNQILLFMQGVTEPVATFKKWQSMDRQVKKGSKAKAILRPITISLKDDLDDQGQPKKITKFKLVNALFAVSDTEGEDLPEYVPDEWSEAKALSELEIERVPFEHIDGNVQGYSIYRHVALNPVAAYPVKTLFHELGHVVLGHTVHDDNDERHKGVKEFQAEAVAYLCMNTIGAVDQMDASASRGYIAAWLKGETPPDSAIKEVFAAVDKILTAGFVSKESVLS